MRVAIPTVVMMVASIAVGQSSQRAPALPPVYGSVSGHITCVDTNQPARLASVTLQTIDVKPEAGPASHETNKPQMMRKYQTSLDGSFFIPKVPPGTYYVVIEFPGYLSPIRQFSHAELEKPTAESMVRIEKAVPIVTVDANHTTSIDTRIERGAELSGFIRYDDGTPLGNISVNALVKEKIGNASSWVSKNVRTQTDDVGHFRITGLPSGEYLLQVILALNETYVNSVLSESSWMMMAGGYSLSFYSGDVARKDKAKPIKLEAGERRDGTDLTIPVSKMHRIVGTLIEQRSGHVINSGMLVLRFSDGTELANSKIDPDDNTFHFDFVPEGEYTLAVSSAKEIVREDMPVVPGVMPMPGQMKETLVREYGTTTQPLIVQSDIAGLTIPIPAKTAKPSAVTQ